MIPAVKVIALSFLPVDKVDDRFLARKPFQEYISGKNLSIAVCLKHIVNIGLLLKLHESHGEGRLNIGTLIR